MSLILLLSIALAPGAAGADPDLKARFHDKLKDVLPGMEITSIRPSPIPGLYEVMFGAVVLYMSEGGDYVVRGDIFDLAQKRNLSEEARTQTKAELLAGVDIEDMIEFKPEGKTKTVLYVFTDIDCPYCRKMHQEIQELTRGGIAVRYLAYPRAGLDSESYDKAVSVWCAEDRNAALTRAKAGKSVPARTCPNPVADQYRLGEAIGITGTPSVMLPDGTHIGGYVPAQELIETYGTAADDAG
jgi:thiol:disulfide interchange protein DsbC